MSQASVSVKGQEVEMTSTIWMVSEVWAVTESPGYQSTPLTCFHHSYDNGETTVNVTWAVFAYWTIWYCSCVVVVISAVLVMTVLAGQLRFGSTWAVTVMMPLNVAQALI